MSSLENVKVLGVTGHRASAFSPTMAHWSRQVIADVLERLHPAAVSSGMATGPDQWAAELALARGLELYANLPVPAEEHCAFWSRQVQRYYLSMIEKATVVEVAMPNALTGEQDRRSVMNVAFGLRNQMVVDDSSALLAVWDRRRHGGTADTIRRALCADVPIIVADAYRQTVTVPDREGLARYMDVTLPLAAVA